MDETPEMSLDDTEMRAYTCHKSHPDKMESLRTCGWPCKSQWARIRLRVPLPAGAGTIK